MLLKGEALVRSYTFGFSISGERGNWEVSITSPGNITNTDETTERTWYPLFAEMLRAAFEAAQRKRFPERRSEAMPS